MRTSFKLVLVSIVIISLSMILNSSASEEKDWEYLGQKRPGLTPEVFGAEIISKDMTVHSVPSVSPNRHMIFWSAYKTNFHKQDVYATSFNGEKWKEARKAGWSTEYLDGNPCFDIYSERLYFHSNRPADDKEKPGKARMWVVEKTSEGRKLRPSGLAEDSDYIHASLSFTKSGYTYFAANRKDSYGRGDLYRAKLVDGKFEQPENLGAVINSKHQEVAPFVAPDESYIIFTGMGYPGEMGNGDLYISYRDDKGEWTKPKMLPEPLNTKEMEIFVSVSADGKYLFFTSDRDGATKVYWVSTKILDTVKE